MPVAHWECKRPPFKGATKLSSTITFVSATKIGENLTNILNYYFSKQIYPLVHQAKDLHVEN